MVAVGRIGENPARLTWYQWLISGLGGWVALSVAGTLLIGRVFRALAERAARRLPETEQFAAAGPDARRRTRDEPEARSA
jgi:hypothetical protein